MLFFWWLCSLSGVPRQTCCIWWPNNYYIFIIATISSDMSKCLISPYIFKTSMITVIQILPTYHVLSESSFIFHVFETIFTYPQLGLLPIILWERWEVPCINFIFPNLNFIDKFDFGYLWKQKDTKLDQKVSTNKVTLARNLNISLF